MACWLTFWKVLAPVASWYRFEGNDKFSSKGALPVRNLMWGNEILWMPSGTQRYLILSIRSISNWFFCISYTIVRAINGHPRCSTKVFLHSRCPLIHGRYHSLTKLPCNPNKIQHWYLLYHWLAAASLPRLSETEPCSELPSMRSVGDIALNMLLRKSKRE